MIGELGVCPGTLSAGHSTYSKTALARVFNRKRVDHVLPFDEPSGIGMESRKWMSVPGVQEKFSLRLEQNSLRLVGAGEQGTHILKPIPMGVKNADQMPANEHLTMQIARQVFKLETAENALIFFGNGEPAYITKRFDVRDPLLHSKWAQYDFTALAQRMPQTHGSNYKYLGNYLELFECAEAYVSDFGVEAAKLFRLVVFNYLFSNGDAHFKNFSILETPSGGFRLSPAYDLLNSRIHVADRDFALEEGLLPSSVSTGNIRVQLERLGEKAGISGRRVDRMLGFMIGQSDKVEKLVQASFLSEGIRRNYWQCYQRRLKRLRK